MRKKVYSLQLTVYSIFVILLTVLCAQSTFCFAQSISSTELLENAGQYDGKMVVYAGEVIGEVMLRGNFAWININDGQAAIGVWIRRDLAEEIVYSGDYKHKGDWVAVSGAFHRACPEHGGDLDIHAQSLIRMGPGAPREEKLNTGKRELALVLLGVLCTVWILMRLKKK